MINNQNDWWELLTENRMLIRQLIEAFHPASNSRCGRKMPITAATAERFCEAVRRRVEEESFVNPLDQFDVYEKGHDGASMVDLLHQTWFGIPESMDAHSLPGFHDLCELCSEGWMFGEQD